MQSQICSLPHAAQHRILTRFKPASELPGEALNPVHTATASVGQSMSILEPMLTHHIFETFPIRNTTRTGATSLIQIHGSALILPKSTKPAAPAPPKAAPLRSSVTRVPLTLPAPAQDIPKCVPYRGPSRCRRICLPESIRAIPHMLFAAGAAARQRNGFKSVQRAARRRSEAGPDMDTGLRAYDHNFV